MLLPSPEDSSCILQPILTMDILEKRTYVSIIAVKWTGYISALIPSIFSLIQPNETDFLLQLQQTEWDNLGKAASGSMARAAWDDGYQYKQTEISVSPSFGGVWVQLWGCWGFWGTQKFFQSTVSVQNHRRDLWRSSEVMRSSKLGLIKLLLWVQTITFLNNCY